MRSKSAFWNQTRQNTIDEGTGLLQQTERRQTTIEGNDIGPLYGAGLDETIPWRFDERARLRVPASIWHTVTTSGSDAFGRLSRNALAGSYFNLGLPLIPIALLSGVQDWSGQYAFALNLLALFPLGHLLDSLTEELVLPLSGWLTRTLVSIVAHIFPLLIALTAATSDEVLLAQYFIIGSIISNLLVGLGGSFVAGAIQARERSFNVDTAATETTLLFVFAIPFVINDVIVSSSFGSHQDWSNARVVFWRSSTIMLIILYILWNHFKLYSHANLFGSDNIVRSTHSPYNTRVRSLLSFALFMVILCIGFCARYMIAHVGLMATSYGLTRRFVGFIILPLVANLQLYLKTYAVAHSASYNYDYDEEDPSYNRMDVAIGLTLSSGVDFALGDLQILHIVCWFLRVPAMSLEWLDTMLMESCIFLVAGLCLKGRSTYLQGFMCFGLYAIIALTYWISRDRDQV